MVQEQELLDKPILLKIYAKKTCKKCRGKGVYQLDSGKNTQLKQFVCECVKRRIKRG
jgi:predicted methyltransferase